MIEQREYSVLARSYATALLHAGRKQGLLQPLQEDCRLLALVLAGSPRLPGFLASPYLPAEKKMELIARVLGGRTFQPMALRMIELLVRRGRPHLLGEILDLFEELIEREDGIEPAAVASARPLGEEDKNRLRAALEKYSGKRLRIKFHVDPQLVGGLVFRWGDVLVDGSMQSALREIRRRLTARPLAA
jgi:F-type H+-transporting ATPase subunit delta